MTLMELQTQLLIFKKDTLANKPFLFNNCFVLIEFFLLTIKQKRRLTLIMTPFTF
jgi:hypothetical protein